MLVAIGLDRIVLGLGLIVAFSFGLAAGLRYLLRSVSKGTRRGGILWSRKRNARVPP